MATKCPSTYSPSRSPKPICSYHCMIGMALAASSDGKLPVNEIYKYILKNFPYFKTAANNWKNSVRHCLSLGQCFHKVMDPESNHCKKGFRWQVVANKQNAVHQEILRYLAATGQTPQSHGIHASKLGDLEVKKDKVLNTVSALQTTQSYGIYTSKLENLEALQAMLPTPKTPSPSYRIAKRTVATALSAGDTQTVTPCMNIAELQLNKSDFEALQMLGQNSNISLSPYDCNLLMNPNMHQELQKILTLITNKESLETTPQQSGQQIDIVATSNTNLYMTPAPNQTMTPPRTSVGPVSTVSDCWGFSSSVPSTYMIDTTKKNSSTSASTFSMLSSNVITATPVNTPPNTPQANATSFCLISPPGLVYEGFPYTSLGPVQKTVPMKNFEFDPSHPFLSENREDGDISLNELNSSLELEDSEEPIVPSKSQMSTNEDYSIEPVEGDWNCWMEPSYIERISSIVGCNKIPIMREDSLENLFRTHYSINDLKNIAQRNMELKEQVKKSTGIGELRRKSHKSIALKKPINKFRNVKRKQKLRSSMKALQVSIPFLKLLTGRQAKKYCQN